MSAVYNAALCQLVVLVMATYFLSSSISASVDRSPPSFRGHMSVNSNIINCIYKNVNITKKLNKTEIILFNFSQSFCWNFYWAWLFYGVSHPISRRWSSRQLVCLGWLCTSWYLDFQKKCHLICWIPGFVSWTTPQ